MDLRHQSSAMCIIMLWGEDTPVVCNESREPHTSHYTGERKWVERNGSNRPPVPWVESSPFRNWVEWTWVDLEKCQVQGRQHIDFDPSPFDPIRPQSIRPKLFDQKGRPNSFRPISFDPFHAIPTIPITKKNNRQLLKPAFMQSTGRIFFKAAMI